MRRIRAAACGVAAALALGLLLRAPAGADPVASPHKAVFPVSCAGQTYEVVAGVGAAAQILDGTAVLVPASFIQVSTWTDPATGQVVTQTDIFSVGQGHRTGQQDRLLACTYDASFDDPAVGTVAVLGTVTGFFASGG
ncbi:MAG TPA: hypothetical protein VH482_35260 [Thermomicrobiales bacterium]|jgi:hypothetical protein